MGGRFFCKKVDLPQRRVHYGMILWYGMVNVNFYSAIITKVSNVQYQYFLFYILLIWGCVRTQRTPPAYGPAQYANG